MLETADAFKLLINGDLENPEMNSALLARHSPVGIAILNNFDSTTDEGKEGSAIFRFAHKGSKNVIAVQNKILHGAMIRLMEDITKHIDDSTLKRVSHVKVMLRCLNNKDSIMSKSNDMGRSMRSLPI